MVAAFACGKHEPETVVPTAVQTIKVDKVTTAAGVRYSAAVEPDAQVSVAFRVGGYVEAVRVEEGDRVTKGAVLARIRQSDYREKFGQAAASQAEAEAGLERATKDLERAKALFAANALTKPELDGAVASFEMTRHRVEAGRAMASEAGIALRDTALIAPISGVILRRNIESGDLSSPGAVAFVLADTNTVKVTFGVPDTMVGTLNLGDPIDVASESMPDRTFSGKVARIAPAADPKSRAFDVELHIANRKNELKPGMIASLEISRGATPVMAIPLAAVIRSPKSREQYAVFVVEQQQVKSRNVDLGDPMGNLVAVKSGLAGGEQIVVSGPSLLTEGQPVRVIGGSYAQER
jgi:RND family efflux transporter MFP subunit